MHQKGETITVLDSYWHSSKYTATSLRRNNVKVIAKGVIETSLICYGKVTADHSPSYYLIRKKKTVTTTSGVVARKGMSAASGLLEVIPKGVTLQKVSEESGWIESYGYIPKKSCTISGDIAKTTSACNIRSSNSKTSVLLGMAVKGAKFAAIDQTDNWVKVRFYVAKARVK